MSSNRKRKKSITVRLIVLGVSVYMLVTLCSLWGQLEKSRNELEALEAERQSVELEIEQLRALLSDGSHADIIEKAARERLGYVFPNEEIYKDISGN